MEKSRKVEALNCPFLKPVVADRMWMYPTGVYCRFPSGRIRVPSRDTVARFCTSGRHDDCPSYRRWRQQTTAVRGPGRVIGSRA